jgi:hypothetical protein
VSESRKTGAEEDMAAQAAGRDETTLQSAELAHLFARWKDARGERRMPPREAIDPVALRDVLPHIVMVDVEREPLRFRYRLVGTYVTAISGRDITGRYADETTFPQSLDEVVGPYQMVVEHCAPVGKYGQARWVPNRPWVRVETLLLPLGRSDAEVEIILCGIALSGRDGAARDADNILSFQGVRTFLNPRFGTPPES